MVEAIKENSHFYIQQRNEYDYLKSLIESLEPGKCAGILLHGPPGTGKTLLAITLAKNFNAPYFIIDGSPDLDRRDIEGNWELIQGNTIFNYGPLTLAIKSANEQGLAFVIINEINAIRESEQISLNSLLSENHINLISKGFEKHELNPLSKLIVIGTMNKGVIGINKLQEALNDRFIASPEINYPEKKKEIYITSKISGCDERVSEIVVDAAREIRKQALEDFSLTKIFSTRLIINFCYLISHMPPKYIKTNIEHAIINKLADNTEEKKSIAMILDGKMFEKKLREALIPKEQLRAIENDEANYHEDLKDHSEVIEEMRTWINKYKTTHGNRSIVNSKGEIKWSPLEWIWTKKKRVLQDYMRLTEDLGLPQSYKQETGKKYVHNGSLTLKYIKWIYKSRNSQLLEFMKEKYPVI
ncbi:MAG: AAA family ATPase [Promethearchaeota archaeon]